MLPTTDMLLMRTCPVCKTATSELSKSTASLQTQVAAFCWRVNCDELKARHDENRCLGSKRGKLEQQLAPVKPTANGVSCCLSS